MNAIAMKETTDKFVAEVKKLKGLMAMAIAEDDFITSDTDPRGVQALLIMNNLLNLSAELMQYQAEQYETIKEIDRKLDILVNK